VGGKARHYMEVSGQLHARYPLDRRLGGPLERYGEEINLTCAGNRTPAV
jgi:hypothetical protein